jgi:hypothetical protein
VVPIIPRIFDFNLYDQDEFLVILIVFLLFLFATEIGFRRGRSLAPSMVQSSSPISTLQTAVMGLLALLLAFSFAMAESRFETRQKLEVDEANALGTVVLRSQVLPEPHQADIDKLLHQYISVRLSYAEAGYSPDELDRAIASADRIQQEIWSEAISASTGNPASIPAGLLVASLNDAFDLQAERDAARQNHVPEIVLYLLFAVAAVAMALVGFGCGFGSQRHLPITISIAFIIAFVILVIMDLDRPRRGFIKVSQSSMLALQK